MIKNGWTSVEKKNQTHKKKKKIQEEYNISDDVREFNDIVLSKLLMKKQENFNSMNLNKLKKKLRYDYQDEAKSRNEDSSLYLKTSDSRPQTLDPKSTSQIIEI